MTALPSSLTFNVSTSTASNQYDQVVWRPDFYGSVLFLVSSVFAVLAAGAALPATDAAGRAAPAGSNDAGLLVVLLAGLAAGGLASTVAWPVNIRDL